MTLLSALVGVAIGTAGFVLGVLNYLRDKPRVVVSLTWDLEPFGAAVSALDPTKPWGALTVTNVGRRPIFVSHASLHVPGETRYFLLNDGIEGVKLLESDPPRRYVIDQQAVRDRFPEWTRLRGCVVDNTGRHWHSNPRDRVPLLKLNEWADMNWRRGLLRLWTAVSVCWIVLVAWQGYDAVIVPRQIAAQETACANARTANPKFGNPFDCFDRTNSFRDLEPNGPKILTYVGVAAAFPFGTLALWFTVTWIVAGFRKPGVS